MPLVFISHSSRDKPAVKSLTKDLRRAGIDVWLDEWHIRVGTPITQAIQAGLESSEYVAVWLTRHAVQSRWVEREWQAKYQDEVLSGRAVVLPLLAEDCAVPVLLKDKRYADFRSDYNAGLAELLGTLGNANPFSIEMSIDFPRGVYWSDFGAPVSLKYTAHGAFGRRKIVVLQRSAGEELGVWHFQFETPISDAGVVQGRVWLGSRQLGDQESHEVISAVVPLSAEFRRHPTNERFEMDDFEFAIRQTVLRDDKRATERPGTWVTDQSGDMGNS